MANKKKKKKIVKIKYLKILKHQVQVICFFDEEKKNYLPTWLAKKALYAGC